MKSLVFVKNMIFNPKPMPKAFKRMISRSLIATLLFTSLTPGVLAESYDHEEGYFDQGFQIKQKVIISDGDVIDGSGGLTENIMNGIDEKSSNED